MMRAFIHHAPDWTLSGEAVGLPSALVEYLNLNTHYHHMTRVSSYVPVTHLEHALLTLDRPSEQPGSRT